MIAIAALVAGTSAAPMAPTSDFILPHDADTSASQLPASNNPTQFPANPYKVPAKVDVCEKSHEKLQKQFCKNVPDTPACPSGSKLACRIAPTEFYIKNSMHVSPECKTFIEARPTPYYYFCQKPVAPAKAPTKVPSKAPATIAQVADTTADEALASGPTVAQVAGTLDHFKTA